MSQTLMIKYYYKGKQFSIKFSEGNFNNNFLINKKIVVGSDPKLYWQIFNSNFPKRHDLVVKDKDDYYINLLKSFSIEIKKDNRSLELSELKSLGILKDNKIILKKDFSGKIIIDENTYFTFNYRDMAKVLTKEDRDNLVIFNQKQKLAPLQRQVRYAASGVVVFTIILYLLIGWGYEPPKKLSKFAKKELEFQTSMDIKMNAEKQALDDEFAFDYTEDTNAGTGDEGDVEKPEEPKVSEADKIRAARQEQRSGRARAPRSGKISVSDVVSNASSGAGQSDTPGTGSILTVRATMSGLTGSRSRDVGFSDIQASSASNLSDLSSRFASDSGSVGSAIVSNSGVKSSEIAGREVGRLQRSGSVNLAEVNAKLGDGKASIEELTENAGEDADVNRGRIDVVEAKKIDLTDKQKKMQFNDWFINVLQPQIDAQVRIFKTKKPIRGQLTISFIFKNDKVVNVNISGQGSVNDSDFKKIIKDLIIGKVCSNLGDYRVKQPLSVD